MVKNFLKKIETTYEKRISLILFFYLIFVTILSLIFSTMIEIKFPEVINNHSIILKELQFNYGELTSNIFYNNNYVSEWNGIDNYLVRYPFLPYFVSTLGKISLNIHLFFSDLLKYVDRYTITVCIKYIIYIIYDINVGTPVPAGTTESFMYVRPPEGLLSQFYFFLL